MTECTHAKKENPEALIINGFRVVVIKKIAIGKAAYHAFSVASLMCILLWVVTMLLMFLLGTDALAPVCICILWIVMRVAFIKEARNPKN